LIKITSRGGNYLLNIGPDALGQVPKESLDILDQVGNYVNENAVSIFGSRALAVPYPYDLDWASFTSKPYTLFIHVLKGQKKAIYLPNIGNKVEKTTLLRTNESLPFDLHKDCEGNSVVEIELPPSLREKAHYCVALHTSEEKPVFESIR
jgi:alpha-L-fucosidase